MRIPEIERDAEQREAGDQQAGDGARLERELEAVGERADRGLRGAHIGAHRDVHADEAGGAREHRADQEAERHQPAEEVADDEEDHDADDADRGVLALEIGLRAFAYGRRDLLHPRVAGVRLEHRTSRPERRRRWRARRKGRSAREPSLSKPRFCEAYRARRPLHGRRCAEPDWSPKAPAESGADIAKNSPATQRSKTPGFVEFCRAQRTERQGNRRARRGPATRLTS